MISKGQEHEAEAAYRAPLGQASHWDRGIPEMRGLEVQDNIWLSSLLALHCHTQGGHPERAESGFIPTSPEECRVPKEIKHWPKEM